MNDTSKNILERMDRECKIQWDDEPKDDAERSERLNLQGEANYEWLKANNIEVKFNRPRTEVK